MTKRQEKNNLQSMYKDENVLAWMEEHVLWSTAPTR